jgi:hypothetical protein
MILRPHQTLWLALLLVSCDEAKKVTDGSEKNLSTSHATKSARATSGESQPGERPHSAVKHTVETTTPEERNRMLSAATWDAIETDPDLALKNFDQMTAGSAEKNRLLEHFAMRLADQDADDAIEWANALTTDDEKSLAFGKIALVLSEKEPERAARMLSESGVPGRDFDVAVVQVVQRWATTSPADAAAWVTLFGAGEARSAGLAEVVSVWIKQDPSAAFAWIPSIPDASLRQEAEYGAAQFILNQPAGGQSVLLKSATPGTRTRFEQLKTGAAGTNR